MRNTGFYRVSAWGSRAPRYAYGAQERVDYLTKVPDGIEWYARLAKEMASSSGEDWPATVAEGDPVMVAGCAPFE